MQQTTKEKLLATGHFLDNEWLDKYVELIEANQCITVKQLSPHATQKHHIIPKCYYKQTNLHVDNSTTNLVQLPTEAHATAHYYLAKAAATEYMTACMVTAINIIKRTAALPDEILVYLSKASSERMKAKRATGWGSHKIPVRCIETQQVFESIKAAADTMGVRPPSIRCCLKDSTHTAKGKHWEYASEITSNRRVSVEIRKDSPHALRGPFYTEAEIALLYRDYPTKGSNIPELRLSHSRESINNKAFELGIRNENFWRKVVCVETGIVYKSISDAVRQLGLTRAVVLHCLDFGNAPKARPNIHLQYLN